MPTRVLTLFTYPCTALLTARDQEKKRERKAKGKGKNPLLRCYLSIPDVHANIEKKKEEKSENTKMRCRSRHIRLTEIDAEQSLI